MLLEIVRQLAQALLANYSVGRGYKPLGVLCIIDTNAEEGGIV